MDGTSLDSSDSYVDSDINDFMEDPDNGTMVEYSTEHWDEHGLMPADVLLDIPA